MAETDLQKRLEKLGEQLVSDIESWEKRTRGERAQVLDQLSHRLETKVSEALTKLAEKSELHQARAEKRERLRKAREERKRQEPTTAGGVMFLIAAVVCAVMGLVNPQMWWMIFVALGLGLGGVGQLTGAAKRRQAKAKEREEAVLAPPLPAKAHEVDALCDSLLADLASAPEAVRSFVSDPQQTVASMRATLKALDQRRQQLLAEDAQGRLAATHQQREALTARHDASTDPETKQRLLEALRSTASQEEALRQLLVITERVDGEYTSLLVHLQELRTRVSVAKSSSTTVQLEGVKGSVQRLNDELAAISEAMDAVRRGDLTPIDPVADGGDSTTRRTRVSQ